MRLSRTRLCRQLKQARQEAQIKQEQVARYLEIPISAVSSLEAGTRKLDVLELVQLAKLYRKPIPWFLEGYG